MLYYETKCVGFYLILFSCHFYYLNLIWPKAAYSVSRTCGVLTLKVPETKIAEFANSVDLDEVAHDEPPHLDLHCLPSNL